MAGKNANGRGSSSRASDESKGVWCGYIWCDMSEQERVHFAGWMENQEVEVDEALKDRLLAGRRIGIRYETESDSWCATFTATGKDIGVGRDKTYALTAWRPTLIEALWLAVYKDTELFKGDWGGGVPQQRRFDW